MQETSLDPLRYAAETAYLAGFFDGEGCIQINKGSLRLAVCQLNPEPLKMFQARYGGQIYHRASGPTTRFAYVWNVMATGTSAALRELLPHLVVKREEAETAIAYLDTFDGYTRGGVPDGVRFHRAELADRLKFLKARDYAPNTLAVQVVEDYFAESDLIGERSSASEGMALYSR